MQRQIVLPQEEQATYGHALAIRLQAERDCDPHKYLLAAAEFIALNMPGAAQACTDRAQHYQEEIPS